MGFWSKQGHLPEQPQTEERFDNHGDAVAVEVNHQFIEIEIDRPYIDLIETMHFYNELHEEQSENLRLANTKALDFFGQFTKVPLGNTFAFFQSVVLFYYKHLNDSQCPFKQSDLSLVFEEVSSHILPTIGLAMEHDFMSIEQTLEGNKRTYFFHEKEIGQNALRYIQEMIEMLPQYISIERQQYPTVELFLYAQELQQISEDIEGDVRRYLEQFAFKTNFTHRFVYDLLDANRYVVQHEIFEIFALHYILVPDPKVIQVMQNVRIIALQKAISESLRSYVSLYEGDKATVLGMMQFIHQKNDALYEEAEPVIYTANQRFFNLFFDEYCFNHQITEEQDSSKVAHFLTALAATYKIEKAKQNGGMLKCSKIIKEAIELHK